MNDNAQLTKQHGFELGGCWLLDKVKRYLPLLNVADKLYVRRRLCLNHR